MMPFRLIPLAEQLLADDELQDLPLQLMVRGSYLTPVDGISEAEVEVRFSSAELVDLLEQGRAAQLTLAQRATQRARRDSEAITEATRLLAEYGTVARTDTGTLQRVAGALHELPDTDLPERGGPRPGESANGGAHGGTEVREHGWSPDGPEPLPPLPRRQPGKGG